MDEIEKQEKINALRGALRDGRNGTAVSDTGASTDPNNGSDDTAFRTTFQDAGREGSSVAGHGGETASNDRQPRSNRRGPKASVKRSRPADRRSSEGDGGATGDVPESTDERTIGRLYTNEAIKERLDPDKPEGSFVTQTPVPPAEKKRLGGWPKGKSRKPKDGTPPETNFKPPIVRKGNTLTVKEATELSEPFIHALESDFQAIDTYLWSRQKAIGQDSQEQPVWTDLDTEEIEALTRVMLKWGQHNETAATVVRGVIDASDYVEVGTIFVPRITRTVQIMRETRKPRVKRGQVQNESNN